MKRKTMIALLCMATMAVNAQVTLKGIGHDNRYKKNGEVCQMESEYVGWNADLQKAIFIVENGIYDMTWDGSALTAPARNPEVVKSEIMANADKALWATNFNMMYGNSGAA